MHYIGGTSVREVAETLAWFALILFIIAVTSLVASSVTGFGMS